MSRGTMWRLIGALGTALVLWLVVRTAAGGAGNGAADSGVQALLASIDTGRVERIRLTGAEEPVELARGGGRWMVGGHDADSTLVGRFLRALASASVEGLAATNPANHARMGLAPEEADTLRVVTDGEERTLLVGDAGPRTGTVFARLPGEDEVWVVEGDLRAHVGREADGWRDRHMLAVDTGAVRALEIVHEGDRIRVEREDSTWTFAGGEAVAPTVVRDVLSELSDLVASGFLAEGDSLAAEPELGSVTALGSGADTLARVRVGSGEGTRWARVEGDPALYRITRFRAERLVPSRERLRPPG